MLAITAFIVLMIATLPWWRNSEKTRLTTEIIAQAPGNTIPLQHGPVHYRLSGNPDGQLVVLLNGFSVPLYLWERNVDALVDQGYQVLQYDYYGRGYSARPNNDYNRALFVDQLSQLLQALKLDHKPLNLVGLSVGGAVTAAYAATHPQQVERVALLAPLHKPIKLGPLLWPKLGRWLAYTVVIPRFAKGLAQEIGAEKEMQHWLDDYDTQASIKGFRRALYSSFCHFMQDDPISDLQALNRSDISTLLVWGEQDTMFPIEESARVREAIGEHQYLQLAGTGHAPQFEKAQQVNKELLRFLEAGK